MPISKKQNTEENKAAESNVTMYESTTGNDSVSSESAYTSKMTLNLYMKEKSSVTPELFCIIIAAILAVLVIIEFFGVYRPYKQVEAAEAELAAAQAKLQQSIDKTKDYDDVKDLYNEFNYEEFDTSIADRMAILEMLDRVVFSIDHVKVGSLTISGNRLDMNMTGLSLSEVSALIKKFGEEKIISVVSVTTTGYNDNLTKEPTAHFTLTLVNTGNGGN